MCVLAGITMPVKLQLAMTPLHAEEELAVVVYMSLAVAYLGDFRGFGN